MNKKELQRLEEKAKRLGKVLLIENYALDIKPDQIEIPSKEIIVESKSSGEKWKARAIIRNVPVSKFTELDDDEVDLLRDLYSCANAIISELDLESKGYRLIVNGGKFQEFPHLHFHLVSD